MAISSAKYEAIHNETGSDLAAIKANFDNGEHLSTINFPAESAIIYQIQKMQEELDYLRGIIDTNNDKVGITTSQANAITANTAKTSMTLGTTGSTALAGDTRIPAFTADDTSVTGTTKSTAVTFGNFTTTVVGKTTTYTLPITVVETTVVSSGKGAGTTTLTKTGAITLT
tara:strand:- start:533 stop:1045 length:513 start_codon:yes stop_codon:yes gene_type:complete